MGVTRAIIRPATVADVEFITQGERAYMHEIEPDRVALWEQALKRNQQLWVANLDRSAVLQVDGRSAGYAIWQFVADTATLITIAVLLSFRRRGFGRLLLDWFVDDAQSRGISSLELAVHRNNGARHLYAHAGFVLVGTDGDYLRYSLA